MNDQLRTPAECLELARKMVAEANPPTLHATFRTANSELASTLQHCMDTGIAFVDSNNILHSDIDAWRVAKVTSHVSAQEWEIHLSEWKKRK
jgi:hypothetical protein